MIEHSPLLPEPGPPGLSPSEIFHLAGFGQRLIARILDTIITGVPAGLLFALSTRNHWGVGWLFPYAFVLGLSALNDVVLTTIAGGTVGKLLVGTRVVRLPDRRPVDAGTAGRRWAAMMVMSFILFVEVIDGVWIFTGQMRQTLHDKFAETIVVLKHPRA